MNEDEEKQMIYKIQEQDERISRTIEYFEKSHIHSKIQRINKKS